MIWIPLVLLYAVSALFGAVGGYGIACWLYFRVHKGCRRLTFVTYTDGYSWRDSRGPMEPSWLTVGLAMYQHRRDMPSPHLWVFQMTENFDHAKLTKFSHELDEKYPHRHIFVAPTFEHAVCQINALMALERKDGGAAGPLASDLH